MTLTLILTRLKSSSAGFVSRWREKVVGWVRLILSDTNSRNLLGFLLLNLTFAFVELIYGVRRIRKMVE